MIYKENFQKIINSIPISGETFVDWHRFEQTELMYVFDKMSRTMQNPEYHAEGDVYSHTKAVCEQLIKLSKYRGSSKEDKIILFLAALLHDIGKIKCTKTEYGKIISPNHAALGAVMAREILWKDFGLCGSKEKQQLRESVCCLIRYHSFPPYAISDEDAEYKILRIASNGELAQDFTFGKLCILCTADILGRICKDAKDYLERTECCEMLAEDLCCLNEPYMFSSDYSGRAYFLGKAKWREQHMYDDTWGEVILLSGLPGTGKDTWILNNFSEMPMISLDEIRKQMHISPTDNQGRVITAAHDKAREYLRKKQPFVWNATDITAQMRTKQISLFEQYGASVKTVFLETSWEEQLRRNSERADSVPQNIIEKLLSKLELPQRFESQKVFWKIT